MNRKQKLAIVVGALVIAGLALFPPWFYPVDNTNNPVAPRQLYKYCGHGFYLRGVVSSSTSAWQVDEARLYNLQCAALALTVAAVLVLKEREGGG